MIKIETVINLHDRYVTGLVALETFLVISAHPTLVMIRDLQASCFVTYTSPIDLYTLVLALC